MPTQGTETLDAKHADILEVISELHARGHKSDFTAIDARFNYDYLELVAILKELCFLGVLEIYRGEYFVILSQEG